MSDHLDTLKQSIADRYVIEREIGRGGMATVYLARDLKHQRSVAIKVLSPEIASILGPERFLQEIEIAARLNHPHILPVFDSGQVDGLLYYVMPFVEGESLPERLTRQSPLPVSESVRIISGILEALAKAHAAGVVHRDVKPGNTMLSDGHALVMDFGVAKAAADAPRQVFASRTPREFSHQGLQAQRCCTRPVEHESHLDLPRPVAASLVPPGVLRRLKGVLFPRPESASFGCARDQPVFRHHRHDVLRRSPTTAFSRAVR